MPHDMVVFGEDWGRHPSSTQHIVSRMGAERAILWINSLGLRRPRLDRRDLGRLLAKGMALVGRKPAAAAGPARPHPFRAVVQPRALPFPGSDLASALNRLLLSGQIGGAIRRAGMRRPVLWTSLPTALPVLGTLDERAVVYYAGDDFAALAGVDHGPVLQAEAELARRADLILAASSQIAARFDPTKTVVVPHGVDFDLFSTPAPRAQTLPQGRVAGFYGSINDWIDTEAIAEAARSLPDWTFLLVGRQETDLAPLAGLGNVVFHDPVPHRDLPGFSQHWDVSLLPFRRNRQIDASNPLKLREYLAAGSPVAATYRFNAIAELDAPVCVPAAGEGLADAISKAAGARDAVAAWRDRLRSHSWEARAELVSQLVDNL